MINYFNYNQNKASNDFYKVDINKIQYNLLNKDESYWVRRGQERAISLFHEASKRVPAYKDFLAKNKVKVHKIKSYDDFLEIPFTDKNNYVNHYPIESRCWDGKIEKNNIIAISSGMSGKSTFWPRDKYQEYEAAIIHELLYKSLFNIDKLRTLLVICFPMGIYSSGIATLLPSFQVSQKDYDLTVLTPGNNKLEIMRILNDFANDYEQLVFFGHPLLLKDVVESSIEQEILPKNKNVKFLFCSEGFTENWRDYLHNLVDCDSNKISSFSTYGSTEFLLMAYETSLSIRLRRLLNSNKLSSLKFSGNSIPNIFQYNPLWRFMEEYNNELIFTSYGGAPLIRFNLHDQGSLHTFGEVYKEINKVDKIKSKDYASFWKLPFVTLQGRSDEAIVFYAVLIYPANIKIALENSFILKNITGKFIMKKIFDNKMNEFLEIHVELNRNSKPEKSFNKKIQDIIVNTLKNVNLEYLDAFNHVSQDMRPVVYLDKYQSGKYFKPGFKHSYIIK